MEMFLTLLPMVYIFLSLFVLLESVLMLSMIRKIRKAFSKFHHRHSELIIKYNIGLKLFSNKAYQNLYFMAI